GEPGAGLSHHRQVEHELEPIRASAHLEQPRFVRFKAAVPTGSHSEQVFHPDPPLPLIEIREGALLEKTDHRLIYVTEKTFLEGDTDQRRSNAFGHGRYIVPHLSAEWVNVGVKHQSAMPHDLNAVDWNLLLANVVEHLAERSGI